MADRGIDPATMDVRGQDLKHVPKVLAETHGQLQPTCLLLDRNAITKLDGVEAYTNLQQLSAADNQLSTMSGVASLSHLTVLNLSSNNITRIDGLRNLVSLSWLSLASNQIKVLENLSTNTKLQHLDVSDNCISTISNLGHLCQLATLLLHDNNIVTLRTAPNHLPKSLVVLSLASNKLSDLTEVGYLAALSGLQQVSLLGNPCIMSTPALAGFDYRPYVVNWILSLRVLDGLPISQEEALKAEWLYSQGKGRHFRPGQHWHAVQYLASVCPLTTPRQQLLDEEEHLSRILQQQQLHQLQLEQQEQENRAPGSQLSPHSSPAGESDSRKRSPHVEAVGDINSPKSSPKSGSAVAVPEIHTGEETEDAVAMASPSSVSASPYRSGPLKAWHNDNIKEGGSPSSRQMAALGSVARHDVHLHDISSSDETASMLEADTRYLPIHSEMNVSPLRPFNFNFSNRPRTAPPASETEDAAPTSFAEIFNQRHDAEKRVAASVDVTGLRRQPSPSGACRELNYDDYDARPSRPSAHVSRLAANFAQKSPDAVRPTRSDLQPQPHVQKRSVSPVTRAQEFPPDSERSSDTGLTTLKLEELKAAIMASRKHRKSRDRDVTRSSQGSLYSSQYSPEKYSTPTRRSLLNNKSPNVDSPDTVTDTGAVHAGGHGNPNVDILAVHQDHHYQHLNPHHHHHGVEKGQLDTESGSDVKEQTLAATKLQALWRGFMARERDPSVVKVRHEMRSRRAEDHIRYLRTEVDRQRKLYEEEKQLRTMQLQVLQCLCQQVQSIQQWQTNVQMSHDPSVTSGVAAQLATPPGGWMNAQDLLEKMSHSGPVDMNHPPRSSASPKPSQSLDPRLMAPSVDVSASQVSTQTSASSAKELELETSCRRLQKQVTQLQGMLTHMSNYVFQGGVISADKEDTGEEGMIRLSADFEQDSLQEVSLPSLAQQPQPTGGARWSVSLAGQQRAPLPGVPTAPQDLRVQQYGSSSVVLQWQPSVILGQNGKPLSKPIIGYRVYVDQNAKGMVAGTQTRALLEGLQFTTPYRLSVRAVSALGESGDSNLVLVSPDSESDESKSSQSQPRDDSDKDRDSSEDHSRGQMGGDSGSGPNASGGADSHDPPEKDKPHSPGGATDGAGSPQQAAMLSSPKAGSVQLPQTSTPKQKSTLSHRPLKMDTEKSKTSSDKPGEKSQKAQSGTAIPERKSRRGVLEQLEKLGSRLSSSNASRRERSSPSWSQGEDRSSRRSRSHSSDRETSKTDADSKGGRDSDSERSLPAGSPRMQEGLIKRIPGKEKGMLVEMKLTSKMLKRKTSPADPQGPLRAFDHQKEPNGSNLTTPSKIPLFKSGKAGSEDALRRSSCDLASVRESLPLARSQSAGSLASGATNRETAETEKANHSDLRSDAQHKASRSDSKLTDVSPPGTTKLGSDTETKSTSHFKYSSDSSPERDYNVSSKHRDASSSHRHGHSGSSQDLEHSGEMKTSSRQRHGSGNSNQDLELSGSGPKPGSGSSIFGPKPPDSPRTGSLSRRNSFKKKKDGSKDGDSSLSPASTGGTGTDTTGSLGSSGASPIEVNVVINTNTDPVSKTKHSDGAVVYSPLLTKDDQPSSLSDHSPTNTTTSQAVETREICHDFSSGAESESDKPFKRNTRGRSSTRLPRKKVEKSERRSASVGSYMQRLAGGCCSANTVVVTNKPPLAKPAQWRGPESDQPGVKQRSPSREELIARKTSRRRTLSEQNAMSSSEDEDVASANAGGRSRKNAGSSSSKTGQASAKQKQGDKKAGTHRRCNSDLAGIQALPDRPESPAPRDRRSAPPSTPTQAPSSPRVRRSSSFSKNLSSSSEKEQQPIVRKGISIQELKAAASEERKLVVQSRLGYDRGAKSKTSPPKQSEENNNSSDAKSSVQKTDTVPPPGGGTVKPGTTDDAGKPSAENPLRRSESTGRVHDLIQQFTNESNKAGVQRRSSMKEPRASSSETQIPSSTHSPRVAGKQLDPNSRQKVKLGRAADLFAKLQMKLSPKS